MADPLDHSLTGTIKRPVVVPTKPEWDHPRVAYAVLDVGGGNVDLVAFPFGRNGSMRVFRDVVALQPGDRVTVTGHLEDTKKGEKLIVRSISPAPEPSGSNPYTVADLEDLSL